MESNQVKTAERGLKTYRDFQTKSPYLAVIGGGTTIRNHVEWLRAWKGDIWAINGAWKWCHENGIDAVFISVDPHPRVAGFATGVRRALLENRCDPAVFAAMPGAEIATFDIGTGIGQLRSGSSTVSAVPHLAARMGYIEITLFGCEHCYPRGATHAYQDENRKEQLLIECGGEFYLTAPDFYLQAMELVAYIEQVPEFIKEESGGLLRAFLKNKRKHHIRWVSDALRATMKPIHKEGIPQ